MSTIEQTFDITGTDEIVLEGYGEVTLRQGDEEVMTIRTEDGVLGNLKTEVVNGKLALGFKNKLEAIFRLHHPRIEYAITVKNLSRIGMSGAGSIRAGSLKGQSLKIAMSGAGSISLDSLLAGTVEIHISGAGSVEVQDLQAGAVNFSLPGAGSANLSGAAPTLDARISGSGSLNAASLLVDSADISISGMGSAEVYVNKELDGSISGMGSIRYGGHPSVNGHTSGMGKIVAA